MKASSQKKSARKIFLVRLRKQYREYQTTGIREEAAWRYKPSLAIAFSEREEAERYTAVHYPENYELFWSGVYFSNSGDVLKLYDDQGEWSFQVTLAEWNEWLREVVGVTPPAPTDVPEALYSADSFWRDWLATKVRETGPAKWHEFWRMLSRTPFEIIEVDFEEK